MPTGAQRYRPPTDPSVPRSVQEALRVAFDRLYQGLDQLGPISVYQRGNNYSGPLLISTTHTTIPGCRLTLGRSGQWTVFGCFSLRAIGDNGQIFEGTMVHRGVTQQAKAILKPSADIDVTVSQAWEIEADLNDSIWLQVSKDGGVGTSVADGENSVISAVWGGPP